MSITRCIHRHPLVGLNSDSIEAKATEFHSASADRSLACIDDGKLALQPGDDSFQFTGWWKRQLPDTVTQVALLPVAYFTGNDCQRLHR